MKTILMLSVILLISACGTTTKYVEVDKTNMKRFEHEQKFRIGMDRSEVLLRFGTPDQAKDYGHHIVWSYYNKIFCAADDGVYCALYFKRGKLVHTFNTRMEFNDLVAGE